MPDAPVYYSWSSESERYRSTTTGRYVSRAAVRASLDTVLDVQMDRVRGLATDLVNGDASLSEWRSGMVTALKTAHLEGAAVGRGGWQQLTQSDYGWVGQRIRSQLGYLQKFHDDLAYGHSPLDGTVASRSTMYVEMGRATQRAMEGRLAVARGEEQERNIGGDGANSCGECSACGSQGWVPIGTLPPVGARQCYSRCHCHLSYRTGRANAEI